MYPDRRPYATTVPQSGYRAKPIVPQPPADALAMLRSHVGYDDPRRSAHDDDSRSTSSVRSAAGRTYTSPTPTERTPQEALASAQLQGPIEHATRTYHGCQQGVLNAELREKVEAQGEAWAARVAALQAALASLPIECTLQSNREVEALMQYAAAYRCTEDLAVPAADVVSRGALRTPLEEVDGMTHLPAVPTDAMRRALDDMLRSPYLLAPLKTYVSKLSVLDALSARTWSGEGSTPAKSGAAAANALVQRGERESNAEETMLCPSRAAVALHERLHFNPGDYAERELKKSEEALLDLQERVQTVKKQKEDAMDANDPITALRSLHAQVDFSNDLLLLYKARMMQVGMHADDAHDFRRDIVTVVDDARRAAETVRAYAQQAAPSVRHDIGITANAIAASQQALFDARATEKAAEAQSKEQLAAMDGESRLVWLEVIALLEKLAGQAQARTHYVQQCMSRREQRARVMAQGEALLKAQEGHRERLRQCEEVLTRWEEIGDVYSKYVEACVPKLLKHVASIEDGDEDLSQREAEGYVAVFEQFVYAAEEARAKRRTQADRMRLLQRNVQLSQERAADTMDPDASSHAQRLADTTRELDEVQLYLHYIDAIEEERRAEVDPVLHRVLARHAAAQASDLALTHGGGGGGDSQPVTPLLEDSETTAGVSTEAVQGSPVLPPTGAESSAVAVMAASAARSPSPPPEAAAAAAAAVAGGPGTMAHPFVAARHIGLAHEANYLRKQAQLTEQELQELEGKQTGLRHSREELRAMEAKYQNADSIRALLGLN